MFLVICVMFAFAFFALGSSSEESETAGHATDSVAATENKTEENELGDYKVEIDSFRMAKDYEGNKVVIIKYIFSNVNDDNATAFYTAFDDAVYQNGVGLNEAYILKDSAEYSADNQLKEIKKGASIEVEVAYVLNDETTDIEVEVKELFSFDDNVLTKTFSIAE